MEIIESGYTRVSEILQIFQAYAFVDRKKLKKAQDLGTDVHDAIEMYWHYRFKPLTQKHNLYFESFLKWVEGKTIEPICIEKRFYYDDLKITGKLDLFCKINGVPTIIDYKTGSWAHPEIWQLQATFYRMLLSTEYKDLPNEFVFLQLMPDGSEPVLFPMIYEPEHDLTCISALNCYRYFNHAPALEMAQ